MHGQACRRWSPRASIADRRLTQACTPGTRAWTASPAEPVARPPFLGVGGRSSEPAAQSRGGRSETLLLRVLLLGVVRPVRHPRSQRRRGGTRVWHRRDHGIENQNNSQNPIASRSSLSRSPRRSLAEASGAADPLQPKSHTLWKTCASRNTFSRTPLPATTLATSDVAPVTLVPSVVRTLRLSLLHSH